jgi:BirA family transcriptional regulator, biotin operon repressor / biotin---[acetyl-CoA-carboxylase] ligase
VKLAPAEELLSRLLAAPRGLDCARAAEPEAAGPARRELETRGYPIVEQGGRWRLDCAGAHFSPQRFAAALSARPRPIEVPHFEVWERIDSTNNRARAAALAGAPAGAVWVAEEQSAGRGRQGRTWQSGAHAGLLFSLLLRLRLGGSERPLWLPLAVALGAAEAVRESAACDVRLRWPNDLVVEGRKLAGILVDVREAEPAYAVVGCGMNWRQEADIVGVLPAPISLHERVRELPRREELLACMLEGIASRVADWEAGRWGSLLAGWRPLDALAGRRVRVHAAAAEFDAEALCVAEDGLLEVRGGDGSLRRLVAAEVHLQ